MSYTIFYHAEEKYIEMKAQGSLMMDEAREIISALLQEVKERNCFFILSDYREATLDISIVKIYLIPEAISTAAAATGLSEIHIKRALVIEKGSKNFDFFETVSINQGQQTKLFEDITEAKKWLLG
jgi:hypothetical protein